jgi:hypothetical protein
MNIDLTGQTAIVTGASRGIGLAVTRALAGSGARVIAGARRSSAGLDKLAVDGTVRVFEADLAEPDGPAWLVAMAGDRIDILVNNVGGAPPRTAGFLAMRQVFIKKDLSPMGPSGITLLVSVSGMRSVVCCPRPRRRGLRPGGHRPHRAGPVGHRPHTAAAPPGIRNGHGTVKGAIRAGACRESRRDTPEVDNRRVHNRQEFRDHGRQRSADQAGLTAGLSAALRKTGTPPLLARGIALVSMAAVLDRIARARARAHVWPLIAGTPAGFPWLAIAGKTLAGWLVTDMDATLVTLLTSDRHAAEDVYQETLHRLFVRWPRVDKPGGFCRQVMHNLVIDLARARQRRPRELELRDNYDGKDPQWGDPASAAELRARPCWPRWALSPSTSARSSSCATSRTSARTRLPRSSVSHRERSRAPRHAPWRSCAPSPASWPCSPTPPPPRERESACLEPMTTSCVNCCTAPRTTCTRRLPSPPASLPGTTAGSGTPVF